MVCAGIALSITVAPMFAAASDSPQPVVPAGPGVETPPVSQGPSLGDPSLNNPLWSIALSKLSATRERPLFAATRRPPKPVIAAPVNPSPMPPPQPDRPQFSLVGTVIGDDENIGVFLEKMTNQAFRLKVGDSRQGWLLRSIQLQSARFEKSGEVVTIDLPRASQKARPPIIARPIAQANAEGD
jgi:general secretion pathway protein N